MVYITQRHGQNGACSTVETAQGRERQGDESYLFSAPISSYTVSPGQTGEEETTWQQQKERK